MMLSQPTLSPGTGLQPHFMSASKNDTDGPAPILFVEFFQILLWRFSTSFGFDYFPQTIPFTDIRIFTGTVNCVEL
jgi:hypothetical protein